MLLPDRIIVIQESLIHPLFSLQIMWRTFKTSALLVLPWRPLTALRFSSTVKNIFNGVKNPCESPSKLSDDPDFGLFGVKGLNEPKDFPRLSKEAKKNIMELRSRTIQLGDEQLTKSSAQQILACLDTMSETICNTADVAEVCRQLHADATWISEAGKVRSPTQEFSSSFLTHL